jgi:PAS domain S-box-containing protein
MPARRILIVANERRDASVLAERLRDAGYAVAGIAPSADGAIASVARTGVDLVLVDLSLGDGVDGVAAAATIRETLRVPVVLTTEDSDGEALARAGITEPFAHVMLPTTDRDLRMTIELALCRHAEATRTESMEDRFFDVSIDMLCCLDFSGYFRRLNPAWERVLGFTRAELMARPFLEFVHPDDRERTRAQNGAVRGGGQALGFENRYRCKDGSYRWLLWNAAPDFSQQVIYSAARDVTARKLAEEDRDRLVNELTAALAEVRTLREILPICSYCRKIRDDADYWQTVEGYISTHTNSRFSHSICPSCFQSEVQPQLDRLDQP